MSLTRYTVWTQEADGTGTTHITAVDAATPEQAALQAMAETLDDWGWDDDTNLRTLGIAYVDAAGNLVIHEWDELA